MDAGRKSGCCESPLCSPDGSGELKRMTACLFVSHAASTGYRVLPSRAGLEPKGHSSKTQVIDSHNRQKRSNRSFRRFEVHGGYMAYEVLSRRPRIIVWKARRIGQ